MFTGRLDSHEVPLWHCVNKCLFTDPVLVVSAEAGQHRGAFLVLQLHDELIYEVSRSEVTQVASIIKRCMETTTPLAVRLPVKVKVGPSWGRLEDMEI